MKAISTPAIYSSDAHIADIDLTFACTEVPLMSIFSSPGWALPVRSNFHYSYEQKKFFCDSFKEGEISVKKMSPEQVHLKMRKDFSPSQYVTVQQIKSLFSRMTAEQRKGTLKEPTKISQPEEYVVSEGEEAIIEDNQVRETACSIMTEILDSECNNWVIVLYNGDIFPGIIKVVLNEIVKVQCMEYEIPHHNCFKWPGSVDIIDYEYKDIVSKIDAPEITGVSAKNKRKDVYAVANGNWDEACKFIDD